MRYRGKQLTSTTAAANDCLHGCSIAIPVLLSALMIEARTTNNVHLLDRPVLVLNRLWQAVHVCTTRRAISLVCSGHAQVVDEQERGFHLYGFTDWCASSNGNSDDELIHSVQLRMRCPKIIVLAFFDRLPRKEVRFTRNNVFSRDKNTCQYCCRRLDRRYLNLDHVVPRHSGGQTGWTNVVCSCLDCNRAKGNRTPEEAGMGLMTEPRKPRWQPFLEVQFAKAYDPAWRHFLDVQSWHVEIGES